MPRNLLAKIGFHPVIRQWFDTQFAAPSPPQVQGWPSIAKGKHTLILAPTGSGKTLAAFLWSIDQLFRQSLADDARGFSRNTAGVHTLYISPLKALKMTYIAICRHRCGKLTILPDSKELPCRKFGWPFVPEILHPTYASLCCAGRRIS